MKAIFIKKDRTIEAVDDQPNAYNEIEYNGGKYTVRKDSTFLWKEKKTYIPTSVWVEDNPMPYDFQNENKGIPAKVLEDILTPRIYRMIAKGDEHPYLIAIIILLIVNIVFTAVSFLNLFHIGG